MRAARAGLIARDILPRVASGEDLRATLPARAAFEATFVAREPQRLPPMVASALRGALLRSVKRLACFEPGRSVCEGCSHALSCAYPSLVSGEDAAASERTYDLPPLLVLRSEDPFTGEPRVLNAGDALRFRVVLVGPAIPQASLVVAGLRGVAGLGVAVRDLPAHVERPRLALVSVREAELATPVPASEVTVRFASPARLHRGGRCAPSLDPSLLWSALVRRARTLATACGAEPPALPIEPPFTFGAVATAPLRVNRWSERQGRRMTWDALSGAVDLRVHEHGVVLAALLAFAEDVQLGKGTQFGFGALRCSVHGGS
jgi:hypothetical protein